MQDSSLSSTPSSQTRNEPPPPYFRYNDVRTPFNNPPLTNNGGHVALNDATIETQPSSSTTSLAIDVHDTRDNIPSSTSPIATGTATLACWGPDGMTECFSPGGAGSTGAGASGAGYPRRSSLQLWQFLVALLDDPANNTFICWTGRGLEFKLIEPEEVRTIVTPFTFHLFLVNKPLKGPETLADLNLFLAGR